MNPKFKTSILAAGLAISGMFAAPARAVEPAVNTLSLVEAVYTHPTRPYKGRMTINTWSEGQAKAEDVIVYFNPPSSYRLEFLVADGSCDRVVLSAGDQQEIQLFEHGKMVKNFIMKNPPKLISRDEGRRLLLQNYLVTVKEAPTVLGRPVWTMSLSPVTPGKPVQDVLIDKATKIVLEVKRHTPQEPSGYTIRMTQFEPNAAMARTLFLSAPVNDSPFQEEKNDQAELSLKGESPSLALLQGGFSLESVDQFEIQGHPVRHMQYTDGLIPLSLFETNVPVQMPKSGGTAVVLNNPLQMGTTDGGQVYLWNKGERHYTLIGDAQKILLQQIASRIE